MLHGARQFCAMRYRRWTRRQPRRRTGIRRRSFPRRRRVRRRPTGNLTVHMSRIVTVAAAANKNYLWASSFLPTDFREFGNLGANFEAYRFTRLRVTVYPLQSVSNNSTSTVGTYVMFPWHRGTLKDETLYSDLLSVDRAKVQHQTKRMSQTYVPSILSSTGTAGAYDVVYRPKMTMSEAGYSERHFTGMIGWQGIDGADNNSKFAIRMDATCILYNQNILSTKV